MDGKYGAAYVPPTALESMRHAGESARDVARGGGRDRRRQRRKQRRRGGNSASTQDADAPDLLVFGYGCNIFRDDVRAEAIEEGRHLIPWMGERDIMIDRFDVRALLSERSSFDRKWLSSAAARAAHTAPSAWAYGGDDDVISFGQKNEVKASAVEDVEGSDVDVEHWDEDDAASDDASEPDYAAFGEDAEIERLCDEERYGDLYDAEERAMLEEEEEKRRQALEDPSSFKMVPFDYGTGADADVPSGDNSRDESAASRDASDAAEEDVPFELPAGLSPPESALLPNTMREHRLIERTAAFVVSRGVQMEIVLKAKQARNPRFAFLDIDHPLHAYYRHVSARIAAGEYVPAPAPTPTPSQTTDASSRDASDGLHSANERPAGDPAAKESVESQSEAGEEELFGMAVPPPDVRGMIDRTAEHVAQNGPSFAEVLRTRRAGDARFAFLNEGGAYHAYFEWAVATAAEGHPVAATLQQWLTYQREQRGQSKEKAAAVESAASRDASEGKGTKANPLVALLGVSSDSDSEGEDDRSDAKKAVGEESGAPRRDVSEGPRGGEVASPAVKESKAAPEEDPVLAERRRRAEEFLKKRLGGASATEDVGARSATPNTQKGDSRTDAPSNTQSRGNRSRSASRGRRRSPSPAREGRDRGHANTGRRRDSRDRSRERGRDTQRSRRRERSRSSSHDRSRRPSRERRRSRSRGRPRSRSPRRRSRSREHVRRDDERGSGRDSSSHSSKRRGRSASPSPDTRKRARLADDTKEATASAETAPPASQIGVPVVAKKGRRWDVTTRDPSDGGPKKPTAAAEGSAEAVTVANSGVSGGTSDATGVGMEGTVRDVATGTTGAAAVVAVDASSRAVASHCVAEGVAVLKDVASAAAVVPLQDGASANPAAVKPPAPKPVPVVAVANPFEETGLAPGDVSDQSKRVAMDLLAKVRAAQKKKR